MKIECVQVCVTGSPHCTVGKKNCIGEITIKNTNNKMHASRLPKFDNTFGVIMNIMKLRGQIYFKT